MASRQSKSDEEEELMFVDRSSFPRRLPWCVNEEDYEAVMAELSAEDCRWK